MNLSVRQLNDKYGRQLLWITTKGGSVIIGELQGGIGATGKIPPETGPVNLTIWKIDAPITYFNNRAGLPLNNYVNKHPSEIESIEPLLWFQPGGAEQLARLAKDRWIRIRTVGNQEWNCIITEASDPKAAGTNTKEQAIAIAELPSAAAFAAFNEKKQTDSYFRQIGHTLRLQEIVVLQVIG
jgi:hypothetical protein